MELCAHSSIPSFLLLGIFVLAIFVGYYVVWNVTPALAHAADVGDQCDFLGDRGGRADRGRCRRIASGSTIAMIFGFLALILASVNIFGGFLVTSACSPCTRRRTR